MSAMSARSARSARSAGNALSRGRVVLALFALMLAVFGVTHVASFPGSVSHFREVTGGQKILDLQPSSSADETWQRLHAMGDAGRVAYLQLVHVVDIVFPLSVGGAVVGRARFTTRRLGLRSSLARVLVALPLAYLVLDWSENFVVLRLLLAFPARLEFEGALVGWVTRGKRVTQLAALVAPLAAFIVSWARSWARARATSSRRRARTGS
jgi:hypothetical protein